MGKATVGLTQTQWDVLRALHVGPRVDVEDESAMRALERWGFAQYDGRDESWSITPAGASVARSGKAGTARKEP